MIRKELILFPSHPFVGQDEVRALGMALGMDEFSVWRHPFPGPGLAIRCLAPLSEENLAMAREASFSSASFPRHRDDVS